MGRRNDVEPDALIAKCTDAPRVVRSTRRARPISALTVCGATLVALEDRTGAIEVIWPLAAGTLPRSGTLIRTISARDMHRKERTIYEKAA